MCADINQVLVGIPVAEGRRDRGLVPGITPRGGLPTGVRKIVKPAGIKANRGTKQEEGAESGISRRCRHLTLIRKTLTNWTFHTPVDHVDVDPEQLVESFFAPL
jgi:hypothetical protein